MRRADSFEYSNCIQFSCEATPYDKNLVIPRSKSNFSQMSKEVTLLIKDPVARNKTWTIPGSTFLSAAEVINMFLMRRNATIKDSCKLKLLYDGYNLADDLDKRLIEYGIHGRRCLLRAAWEPVATPFHMPESCERCLKIAASEVVLSEFAESEVLQENDESVKSTYINLKKDAVPFIEKDIGHPSEHELDDTSNHQQLIQNASDKSTEATSYDKPLVDIASSLFKSIELLKALEKLVSACHVLPNIVDQLERLNKLFKEGAITETEYADAKHVTLSTQAMTVQR